MLKIENFAKNTLFNDNFLKNTTVKKALKTKLYLINTLIYGQKNKPNSFFFKLKKKLTLCLKNPSRFLNSRKISILI